MTKSDILSKIQDFWFETRVDFFKSIIFVWHFWHLKILTGLALLTNIINWFFARYISEEIGLEKIALHYNVDFGIDLYDNTNLVYTIPLLGTVILFFNFFLVLLISKYLKKDIKFISYILLVSALVANIILIGATVSVYVINFQ